MPNRPNRVTSRNNPRYSIYYISPVALGWRLSGGSSSSLVVRFHPLVFIMDPTAAVVGLSGDVADDVNNPIKDCEDCVDLLSCQSQLRSQRLPLWGSVSLSPSLSSSRYVSSSSPCDHSSLPRFRRLRLQLWEYTGKSPEIPGICGA